MNEKRYFYVTPEDYVTAEKNGIPQNTVYQRVRNGWDVDRAITEPVGKAPRHTGNWAKWKDKSVVCYGTFASRVRDGWTPEKAALTPPIKHSNRQRKKRTFTDEQLKIAESNGIPKSTVSNRYFGSGWDIEKAITTPVMTKKEASMLGTKRRRELFQSRGLVHD